MTDKASQEVIENLQKVIRDMDSKIEELGNTCYDLDSKMGELEHALAGMRRESDDALMIVHDDAQHTGPFTFCKCEPCDTLHAIISRVNAQLGDMDISA